MRPRRGIEAGDSAQGAAALTEPSGAEAGQALPGLTVSIEIFRGLVRAADAAADPLQLQNAVGQRWWWC